MPVYTNPWDETTPADSDQVKQGAFQIRKLRIDIRERLVNMFGIDISNDPVFVSKVGAAGAIIINGKLAYVPEFDAGSSGASKTLDLVANGPNQVLTLTQNCVLTIPTPPAGSGGMITLIQDGTGGRGVTWPSNVRFQNSTLPYVSTTAGLATAYPWYARGTVMIVSTMGTAFNVS